MTRHRATFAACALATIALGLWVHRGGAALGRDLQDVTGDALWGAMICCWIGVLAPGSQSWLRATIAMGICTAVELSQRVHTPLLDGIRATSVGRLVLGSGFDARDLLAYAIGITVAVVVERILRRRETADAPDRRVGR